MESFSSLYEFGHAIIGFNLDIGMCMSNQYIGLFIQPDSAIYSMPRNPMMANRVSGYIHMIVLGMLIQQNQFDSAIVLLQSWVTRRCADHTVMML